MAEKSSELEIFDDQDKTALNGADNKLTKTGDDDQILEIDERTDAKNDDEATDEAEEIRGQIVQTRREMSETIDAIQEKLSFANISEQVKDQVSEQIGGAVETVKQAAFDKAEDFTKIVNKSVKNFKNSDIAKTARENPWLLSVIGAGVGALIVGSLVGKRKKRRKNETYQLGSVNVMKYGDDHKTDSAKNHNRDFDADEVRQSDDYRRDLKFAEVESGERQTTRSKIGDAASSAYETVSNVASSAYEGVSGAAGTAYESVGGTAKKSYKGVSKAAGFAYDKAGDLGGHVKTNYDYYIEENPLIVGAAALAIGAAVGMAIPLTKTENDYFGTMRDNAVDKIQATAQDAVSTAKQVVGEAQKTFGDEIIGKMKS